MSDQNQIAGGPLLEAAPAPSIHIAGDVNVYFGRQDKTPAILPMALLAALTAGKPGVASDSETPPATPVNAGDLAPRKILADGSEVPATDPRTDHVALHFPETGLMIARTALSRDGRPFDSQQQADEAGKALRLLGYDDWINAPVEVYERHVIDRRFHKPAVDRNLYPDLPFDDTYWTSTITAWSEASAFNVYLYNGDVSNLHRSGSGFGLACRRARQ